MREDFLHTVKDTKQYVENFRGGSRGGGGWGGFSSGTRRKNWYGGSPGYGYRRRVPYYMYTNPYPYDYDCTPKNRNPLETGGEIPCCPGLRTCYADWNNTNNPFYLCKESCD